MKGRQGEGGWGEIESKRRGKVGEGRGVDQKRGGGKGRKSGEERKGRERKKIEIIFSQL